MTIGLPSLRVRQLFFVEINRVGESPLRILQPQNYIKTPPDSNVRRGSLSWVVGNYFSSTKALPVISAGCSKPISFKTVGATSANTPFSTV